LPFPPKSGGAIKSWNYVKNLESNFTLGVACFLKEDDTNHVAEFTNQISLKDFIGLPLSVSRSPINLILSYFMSPSLNVFRNRSSNFSNALQGIIKDYDLILVDHYEMFQYVPSSFEGKVVMHTHNAEFMLWKRMSELTSNPLKKIALKLEEWRVKQYERKIFKNSHLVFSTPSDIALYKKEGFNTSRFRTTFHLGNTSLLDLPDLKWNQTKPTFLFMGTLSWEPNIDGILWFIEKVWPEVLKRHPDCTLSILGHQADPRLAKAAELTKNISFPGFVNNLENYLKHTRVFIVPLRFGSGMKVKVLDGLYRGTPMVTTSIGAEGIDVKDKQHLLIEDDVHGFALACVKLLESKELWEKLSTNSRKVASEKYHWEPLFEKMTNNLLELYPNGSN